MTVANAKISFETHPFIMADCAAPASERVGRLHPMKSTADHINRVGFYLSEAKQCNCPIISIIAPFSINRYDLANHMWSAGPISEHDLIYIQNNWPKFNDLKEAIQIFRQVFTEKTSPAYYPWSSLIHKVTLIRSTNLRED